MTTKQIKIEKLNQGYILEMDGKKQAIEVDNKVSSTIQNAFAIMTKSIFSAAVSEMSISIEVYENPPKAAN